MRQIYTLCYHKVSDDIVDFNNTRVSISNFDRQVKWLAEHYDIIRLEEYEEHLDKDGDDAVTITFDDGYADVYYNALPILEKYGVPATVFITTGNVDTPFANYMERIIDAIFTPEVYRDNFELKNELIDCKWYTRDLTERICLYKALSQLLKHLEPSKRIKYEEALYKWAGTTDRPNTNKRVLSSDEIKKLSDSKLITIGSHTVNHSSLGCVSKQQQKYELLRSKSFLEEITNKKVELFAYPWGALGDYTDESIELLKETGYKLAFTTSAYELSGNYNPYILPRWVVFNYSINEFEEFFLNSVIKQQPLTNNISCSGNAIGQACPPIVYIGSIESDTLIMEKKADIIIWGAGDFGKRTYGYLYSMGAGNRVQAFGDNNSEKQGTIINDVKVVSVEEIIKKQNLDNNLQIIVAGRYCWEVFFDLHSKGLKNFHIII